MSMKVYDAYKVKDPKIVWPLLWKLKEQLRKDIGQLLRSHYWELMINIDPESEAYKKAAQNRTTSTGKDWVIRLDMAHEIVKEGYKKAVTQHQRDQYNLDVTIGVCPHKGQFYLRAFHDHASILRGVTDSLAKHRGLTDFHFQNSSDKPRNVTRKAWDERERIWNEMCDAAAVPHGVDLVICSWDSFHRVDPWLDLYREFAEKTPVLPSREEVWAAKLQKNCSEKVKGSEGLITKGRKILVRRLNTRWMTLINGKKKYHKSLDRAADYAYYCHLPDDVRRQVDHMIKDHRQYVRKQKAREKALAKKAPA